MANAERQMPEHVEAAYRDAVENILFLKRQQWLATNYVLLLYAAIFVISAYYFSRTDVARNWLGAITIAAFVVHWCVLHLFNARSRSLEIAWLGFTGAISAKRSARDWMCGWNQGHIGMNLRFTLAS